MLIFKGMNNYGRVLFIWKNNILQIMMVTLIYFFYLMNIDQEEIRSPFNCN